MKSPTVLCAGLVLVIATAAVAQRPRNVSSDSATTTSATPSPAPAPAPTTFKAKYEGGVFGNNRKINGTLTFDDVNTRIVFRNEKQKEVISMPYNSLTSAFADTHAVQPKSATIASNVPSIYALPAHFIKTKVQYLTIQYNDPDSKVSGVTSFKVANKELLASVLSTLAGKAGLSQRGDVYVRKN